MFMEGNFQTFIQKYYLQDVIEMANSQFKGEKHWF